MLAYLDHAASGPVHPAAAAAMRPWLTERFGNPSGVHQVARAARAAVDEGREAVAAALGTDPGGVTFTSGGTEADNLAVLGTLAATPGTGRGQRGGASGGDRGGRSPAGRRSGWRR